MPFKKFVEIGRVAFLADGPEKGKIAAIVNVIDQNKVLIDGPTTGVSRQAYPIKQIHLTNMKVTFPFDSPTRVVRKELTAAKVDEKWAESSWAKRLENKAKRLSMNDFDRFKLRVAKTRRNRIVSHALNSKKKALKKAAKK
uniref:Large ribosomal subunit protein eL14 n=1 Tax=Acartia pacifica TaxID=335913 RepID=A0A0U2TGA4_ACAPC|nr:60S ribosomal protein L14 [Acartia pacifica]ALS04323.1 60S ribosomal protein L14 [Acartia pacifica]ALS04324.1 60S ribosomal protein L14 [Acartia pacifica]ALS04325.1 60S ribosomal protein L14 [Acartia pacifica]